MIAVIIFSVLTVLVLIAGLVVMAKGGKLNRKFATKLMSLRVLFQLIAILLLAALYLTYGK